MSAGRIGNARPVTGDQHLDAQADALTAASDARVFTDTAAGELTLPAVDADPAGLPEVSHAPGGAGC